MSEDNFDNVRWVVPMKVSWGGMRKGERGPPKFPFQSVSLPSNPHLQARPECPLSPEIWDRHVFLLLGPLCRHLSEPPSPTHTPRCPHSICSGAGAIHLVWELPQDHGNTSHHHRIASSAGPCSVQSPVLGELSWDRVRWEGLLLR